MNHKTKAKKKPVVDALKNTQGAIMIRVGHEQASLIHKAAKRSGMSKSKLCSILSRDGAAKINAGSLVIKTLINLVEK